jgi:tetratricopeptide (TPR) repeat protein
MKFICILIAVTISACGEKKKNTAFNTPFETKESLLLKNAQFLYEQDKYQTAIIYFDSLISIDSTQGKYFYERAYSYTQLSNRERAIKDYKKSIEYQFKVNDSYYNIGVYYFLTNDSLAIYYFQKCLSVDPGYTDAYDEILFLKKKRAQAKNRNQ